MMTGIAQSLQMKHPSGYLITQIRKFYEGGIVKNSLEHYKKFSWVNEREV